MLVSDILSPFFWGEERTYYTHEMLAGGQLEVRISRIQMWSYATLIHDTDLSSLGPRYANIGVSGIGMHTFASRLEGTKLGTNTEFESNPSVVDILS